MKGLFFDTFYDQNPSKLIKTTNLSFAYNGIKSWINLRVKLRLFAQLGDIS